MLVHRRKSETNEQRVKGGQVGGKCLTVGSHNISENVCDVVK